METKDLPLNMPCSDPEGCKHFKNAMKLQERIKELEKEIHAWREREYCDDCSAKTILPEPHGIGCKAKKRIKELEMALKSIWPFIEEDFPKGTSDNHGTCATDSYVLAARKLEQVLKG